MKKILWTGCVAMMLGVAAGILVAGKTKAADDEVSKVRAQCTSFKAAWNKHDPKAMAAVFAENADAYNPHRHHAVGRAEIEKMFTEEQTGSGPLRESTLEVKEEPFKLITPDVAITDADANARRDARVELPRDLVHPIDQAASHEEHGDREGQTDPDSDRTDEVSAAKISAALAASFPR
jgi:uncharacterized protein (TIGR02246 family)